MRARVDQCSCSLAYTGSLPVLFTYKSAGLAARSAMQPKQGPVYVTGGGNMILSDYHLEGLAVVAMAGCYLDLTY